ncbi:PAS domain S-box-containing protein [Chitinophaga sp. CF118]|uniref:PAS domain-containing protein n=1 Tax=Chitinophaga sp. CF118 TaxID=1884367 RepID=UPI0008DFCFCB|nr:PAS domain S-box protein [Chitinophaga sp. CF118]SFD47939.1 PAS domain S-box-containing protein [Chitinophaga sp. CF118]
MNTKTEQSTKEIQSHLQSHLAAIVESSDDAIISKTMDGLIVYWNVGAERIFGYSSLKVLGKSINILAPHETDEHKQLLKKYKKGEKLEHYETQRVKEDGSIIDVSLTISPILDGKKKVVGFSTIARDITKRVLYSQYARSLIEASLDPLVTISANGKITDVNEASVKVTGLNREKLIGTDFSDYFTEPEKAREGYQQVFEKSFVADYPLTIRHISGKLTDVLYNASVYKDDRGNVLGVFAAARDITTQKQASQYARSLIEASLDPLVTISADGKITDVNEASVKVTGINREKLIGTDFSNYFTEPEKARKGYQQVFEKGFVADYPLTIRHISEELTDVLYNASVYKDNKGNVLGVFAAARDITTQKQLAEREVAGREKELMRLEELERFRKLTVGRELKMIELKKEIEELKNLKSV